MLYFAGDKNVFLLFYKFKLESKNAVHYLYRINTGWTPFRCLKLCGYNLNRKNNPYPQGVKMPQCNAEGYLETLQKTAHALSGVLQETEIVQLLLEQVVSALSMHKALVLLLGREGDRLVLSGATGLSEDYLKAIPLGLDESRINRRVLDGELVVVDDSAHEPEFCGAIAAAESLGGMVAVPMSVRDRVIGVLHVYMEKTSAFKPEEFVLLRAMTDLGALALEKVRLGQSLFRIAEAISSSLELEPMLQRVLNATVEDMWLKAASIRLLKPKENVLRLVASYGLSEAYLAKGEVHLDKSEIDRRVLQGEVVVLQDVQLERGFEYVKEAAREGIQSILAVPLTLKTRTLGVMRAYSARPRHFGPVAVTFLKSVADLVSLAIENAHLYAALQARHKELKLDLADWYRFLALG
jgi:GAF domain-containing protein